jgi:3-hydroxyacyl-CoA dehydrogenase
MSELVQVTQNSGIAVITVNNPPVNALSPGVPEGICEAIEKIDGEDSIKAGVLIGGGRTFVAGADIREFGKDDVRQGTTKRGDVTHLAPD